MIEGSQYFGKQMRRVVQWVGILVLTSIAGLAQAQLFEVPAGNRNASQPTIPNTSASRTKAGNGSFQQKYEKIRDLISSDKKLQNQIKISAKKFGIDPVHIVGALVGEHTYNVDALDFLQTYFVKAASYLKSGIEFAYDGETVVDFVKRPQFSKCAALKDSYQLWDCREEVWQEQFEGKSLDGKSWPNDRFSKIFFQPYYAGQTFGLGQLNPLTALGATDMVAARTGAKKLDAGNAPEVYATIMRPDTTLDYMAAIIRLSIDAYKSRANLDISNNPGITATLYNLGDVRDRADMLAQKRATDPNAQPEENYYGWLVNDKIEELRTLLK